MNDLHHNLIPAKTKGWSQLLDSEVCFSVFSKRASQSVLKKSKSKMAGFSKANIHIYSAVCCMFLNLSCLRKLTSTEVDISLMKSS